MRRLHIIAFWFILFGSLNKHAATEEGNFNYILIILVIVSVLKRAKNNNVYAWLNKNVCFSSVQISM